jgi:hypothetical protein
MYVVVVKTPIQAKSFDLSGLFVVSVLMFALVVLSDSNVPMCDLLLPLSDSRVPELQSCAAAVDSSTLILLLKVLKCPFLW